MQDAYDGVEGEGVRGACAVSSPLLSTSRTVQASQWRDLQRESGGEGEGEGSAGWVESHSTD